MLNVILRILSVLGIIVLVLLAVLAVLVLLVLFFPFSYRIRGSRDEEGFQLSVKVRWLFGLLRLKYEYPESGHMVVKAFCFTLYDIMIPGNDSETEQAPKRKHSQTSPASDAGTASRKASADDEGRAGDSGTAETVSGGTDAAEDAEAAECLNEDGQGDGSGKILQKFKKIKYTIYRIYDKIKKIWKNISYYMALVQEEETKQVFAFILLRLGKICKRIRPKRIKADIVFGTGSPDTTGYAYGAYCILSSMAGTGLQVTPDFEQAVFRGRIDMSGHIAIWVLGWNGLKVFLDKNLRRFLKKVKTEA